MPEWNRDDQEYRFTIPVILHRPIDFSTDDLRVMSYDKRFILRPGIGHEIKMMTNNPKKIIGLEGYGLKVVETIPLLISPNPHNLRYLKTNKEKLGHLLEIPNITEN